MNWSADVGGLLNVFNPFAWLNYSNQRENQRYQRQQDTLNRQMQYDFAQNSIKWRTADAKSAGIHPLAALGVSPSSASPVYSSSDSPRAEFGELAKIQLDLARAEVRKTNAEAEAIEGQSSFQPDVSNPSGVKETSLVKPEKMARVTERPADNNAVVSYSIEPDQQEIDKYESLPFLTGAVEYLRNYHFNGIENLNRARPKIEDNLRKLFKKKGKDFDMEGSLVVRGNKLTGYTLDFVPHDKTKNVINPLHKYKKRWFNTTQPKDFKFK